MRLRILAATLALSTGVLAVARTPVAYAQSAAELVAARALFTEGLELEKKKDYAGALEKFRKVVQIKSTAIVRYHEGYCAERLGHWIEALDAYAKATVEGQGDPKQKDAYEAARKAGDVLRPRVPRIRTKVTGIQKGKYDLRIDGTPVSPALIDAAVPVDVGKHLVEITGEGIAADSQEITVAEKETRDVVFEAKEPGSIPTPPKPPLPKPPLPKPPLLKDDDKVAQTKPTPAPAKPEPPKTDPEPEKRAPKRAIVFGLSLSNVSPGGQILDPSTSTFPSLARQNDEGVRTSDQADYFGWGPGLEVDVGFRFLEPLAAYVFFQRGFMSKSGFSREKADFTATTDAYGLGLMFNSHPNSLFGLYADASISLRRTKLDDATDGIEVTMTGLNPLRLKLGVAYKPIPTLTVLAYAWGTFGSYSNIVFAQPGSTVESPPDVGATHYFLGGAVGATYDLGL